MLWPVTGAAAILLAVAACSSTSTNQSVGGGGATTGGAGGASGSGTGGAPDGGGAGGAGGASTGGASTGGAGGSGGSGAEGPSCNGLAPCTTADNCCTNVLLPGGEFQRDNASGAEHTAKVSSFRLDAFEVTVGRFRKFVGAGAPKPKPGSGAHTHVAGGIGGWDSAWDSALPLPSQWDTAIATCGVDNASPKPSWSPTPKGKENHPMNCVSFPQAFAFCIWDGGFLPTEAELNYAYVNGSQQTTYPWGNNAPAPTLAVYDASGPLQDVGTKPKTGLGFFDLAGNLYEFTLDSYLPLGQGYPKSPCADCAVIAAGVTEHVIRGGGWLNYADSLKASDPTNRIKFYYAGNNVGFRCARSP